MSEGNERQPLLSRAGSTSGMGAVKGQAESSTAPVNLTQGDLGYFEKRKVLRDLERFYEYQDKIQTLYREDAEQLEGRSHREHADECNAESEANRKWDSRFASIIFVMNICVMLGNVAAAILSVYDSKLSQVCLIRARPILCGACVDSSMDIMTSVIVFVTVWMINNTNQFNYPRGRQRLELIAVISCSIFMGVANIMMIIQSAEAILMDTVDPDANIYTILIMGTAITSKLVMMVICYRHGTTNSRVLALDQRNDSITGIVAIAGAYVGQHYWKYADPIGAILVCTFIAFSWFCNAFEHVPMVVGRRAEQEHLSRLLAIAISHDPRIRCLDHVLCYHVGERALVELHVVLDEHLPLRETHDVCETLEDKLNRLDFVERTFIHVDYRCDGDHDGK